MPVPPADAPRPPAGPILRSLRIDPSRLHPVEKALLILAAAVAAVSAAISVTDVAGTYGGIDIRNRVVGSRALAAGLDPYTYHWKPGDPETLFDPVDRDPVPRVTVPPTTLCLYTGISWLPYRTIRLFHFALEWAALLASIWMLAPIVPGQRVRVGFLIIVGLFVSSGAFWRMHTERGQVYVVHLLLLSLGVRWALAARLDSWRAGIAFGLAVALRPSFAPLLLAFLALGRFRTIGGGIAAGALAVGLTLPLAGPDVWRSYFRMGDDYYTWLWAPERLPPGPTPPTTRAEGFEFGQPIVEAGTVSGTLARVYTENRPTLGLPVVDIGKVSKAIMAGLTGLLLLALVLGRRRARQSPRLALLLILVVVLDLEYLLPHRWAYADVHWVAPLALALPLLWRSDSAGKMGLVFALGGLVLGNSLALETAPATTTLVRTYLLASGLTAAAVGVWYRRRT